MRQNLAWEVGHNVIPILLGARAFEPFGRLHAGIGDHRDRMPIHLTRQRQPLPQAAAGRLHDPRAGPQLRAGPSHLDHVHGRSVFHAAAGIKPFQLGPKPAVVMAKRCRDAQHRSVAHQGAGSPIGTGPRLSTTARLENLQGWTGMNIVVNRRNVSHVIVAFMGAARAAIDVASGHRPSAQGTTT